MFAHGFADQAGDWHLFGKGKCRRRLLSMTTSPFAAIGPSRPLVLLGCGNMGKALLGGWLAEGLDRTQLFILDPALNAGLPELDIPPERCGSTMPADLKAGILMLAVKPQILDQAVGSVRACVDAQTTLLSVMAGVSIDRMDALLPGHGGIVRTMPNTPAAIGKGVTGLYAQSQVSALAKDSCEARMRAAGATVWVETETDLNAVTAVSGSGPAYIFHMIECLTDAGIAQGLTADVAETLAIETVHGAGALAAGRAASPEQLRINVTSPGGTTEAGLNVLMRSDVGLQGLIAETVAAARKRAEDLA